MFPIFLKTGFRAEIPINGDRILCIVPRVESICISDDDYWNNLKWDKTEEGQNAKLCTGLSALSGLK